MSENLFECQFSSVRKSQVKPRVSLAMEFPCSSGFSRKMPDRTVLPPQEFRQRQKKLSVLLEQICVRSVQLIPFSRVRRAAEAPGLGE